MSKEFTYKKPKTTDSYRKGWEKAFSGKYKGMMSKKQFDKEHEQVFEGSDEIDYQKSKFHPEDIAETTEQKQPNEITK